MKKESLLLLFFLYANFTLAQVQVGINTQTPTETLDVNGTLRVVDSVTLNNKVYITGIEDANIGGSYVPLVVNQSTGEVVKSTASSSSSPSIFLLNYHIQHVDRDYLKDYNTNIPTDEYVVSVVGLQFSDPLELNLDGEFTPITGSAFKNQGTWRIKADYRGGFTRSGVFGDWTISILAIKKSLAVEFPTINDDLGGSSTGSSPMPPGM